jgi:diguanylate cyclase (GGDEF)-like protein/PAS domain S-box-containing protein
MVEDTLMTALVSNRAVNGSFRCQREDGEVRWIELFAKAVQCSRGESGRLVGVYRDITERKQVDQRLRQTAVVYEATAEAILILDRGRRIVSANPAFTTLTGCEVLAALGRDPDDFLYGRPLGESFYNELISDARGQWQGELQIRRRDGTPFPAWQTVSVVRDDSATVSHFVVVVADLTAVREAEGQLRHLAQHDPLTGLPNRLLFEDRLEQALAVAVRENGRFALLFIDLDKFKVVNDTLGHQVGDEMLKTVTERILASIRRSDTAARFGGDEFVVIMVGVTHAEDAAQLAVKLLDTIAQPVELAGERVEISASIGISVFPDDSRQKPALMQAADNAMYSAKSLGGNRYSFYAREMGTRAAARLAIERGLKRALAGRQFELHYQPIVDLGSGRVCALEALLRWRHPTEGVVGPEAFIGIAEDSGLIEPIGRWVLRTACAAAAAWNRRLGIAVRMHVNVSMRQLLSGDFVQVVVGALADSGLLAALLSLEMTESALQSVAHGPLLRELKSRGVGIAIDDFGTGYSSLGTLRHWPIDQLKIDRSLIRDVPGDRRSEAIMQAIVTLGSALEMPLVAEGVEEPAQLGLLSGLGCQQAQGNLVCRPMPAAEVESMLAVHAGSLRPFGATH